MNLLVKILASLLLIQTLFIGSAYCDKNEDAEPLLPSVKAIEADQTAIRTTEKPFWIRRLFNKFRNRRPPTPTHETNSILDLPKLPNDVLEDILLKNGLDKKDLANARKTSKATLKEMKNLSIGSFSVVGSPSAFIYDENFCEKYMNTNEKKRQIRKLHMAYYVYEDCGISHETSPFIEELYLVDFKKSASDIIALWELFQRSYKELKRLEVIDEYGNGILTHTLLDPAVNPSERLTNAEKYLSTGLLDTTFAATDGNTLLHTCLVPELKLRTEQEYFNTVECVKLMLKYGASPNQLNERSFAPVHLASMLLTSDALELMVKNGGDINLRTEPSWAYPNGFYPSVEPIFFAVQYRFVGQLNSEFYNSRLGWIDYCAYGKDLKFSEDMETNTQFTQSLASDPEKKSPRYYLLRNGADPSIIKPWGRPALFEILDTRDLEFIMFALDYIPANSKLLSLAEYGLSPFPYEFMQQQPFDEVLMKLITVGFNVNYKFNLKHESILYYAVEAGNTDMVRELIARDIDVSAADMHGLTAIMFAPSIANINIALEATNLLVDAGANFLTKEIDNVSFMSTIEGKLSEMNDEQKNQLFTKLMQATPKLVKNRKHKRIGRKELRTLIRLAKANQDVIGANLVNDFVTEYKKYALPWFRRLF